MNKQKRKRRQTSRYLLMGGIAGAVAITLLVLMIIPNLFGSLIEKLGFFKSKISIPLDLLLMRFIEVFSSIPRMLLILTIVAISKPSIVLVMVIV